MKREGIGTGGLSAEGWCPACQGDHLPPWYDAGLAPPDHRGVRAPDDAVTPEPEPEPGPERVGRLRAVAPEDLTP